MVVSSGAEAAQRFDLLLVPALNDEDDVTLYEGPTTLPSLDLEDSIIVNGDLTIQGDLCSHDESGVLFVNGDLHVGTIASNSGQIVITGSVMAEHADYNHGYLHIAGDLKAKVIVAEHDLKVDGRLSGLTIDFGGFRCTGLVADIPRKLAVYDAAAIFVDEVIDGEYADGPTRAKA